MIRRDKRLTVVLERPNELSDKTTILLEPWFQDVSYIIVNSQIFVFKFVALSYRTSLLKTG